MEITHSYQGMSQQYFKASKGTPKFAEFVVGNACLDNTNSSQPLTVLELGVGSGQQTEFVEEQLRKAGINQYKILAYDKSSDQLDLLKERIAKGEISERILPIQSDFDGTSLEIEPESINFSYTAWVFHHLTNKQTVLDEIARITPRGGRHFMYQVTIEDLEDHQLNEFFPMKYEYDRIRYPTWSDIESMFENAGFSFQKPEIIRKHSRFFIDRVLLEHVENTSFDSVFKMIKDNDPHAFTEGVNRIRQEVKQSERSGNFREYRRIDSKVFWGIRK